MKHQSSYQEHIIDPVHRKHYKTLVETDRRFRALESHYSQMLNKLVSVEKEVARLKKRWQTESLDIS